MAEITHAKALRAGCDKESCLTNPPVGVVAPTRTAALAGLIAVIQALPKRGKR